MNFNHLHVTDPTRKYAFFVHECEPQSEPLKPIVYPNDKLPDLVAKMVQRGLDFTAKATANPLPQIQSLQPPPLLHHPPDGLPTPPGEMVDPLQIDSALQHQLRHHHQETTTHNNSLQNSSLTPPPQTAPSGSAMEVHNLDAGDIQINQLVPLQNVDGIKLEVPQFQQVTQVLVSEADIGEPILFCQPTIMLDPSQVIPVSTHSFAPHFLQLHPQNLANQQGQYL